MKNRYSKYKPSGVEWIGDMPEHWVKTKVKWELQFHNNKRVPIEAEKRGEISGEYRYYGASGVIDFVNDYIFDGDYILVGEDGANILSRSSPLAFVATGRFWVNNHAHILKNRSGPISYFANQIELNDFSVVSTGSAQPKLTKEALGDTYIVVPPLPEQEQIVKYLDEQTGEIDNLISITEHKIELLKENRTSTINRVITKGLDPKVELKDSGVEWIGEIPNHWEVKKLFHLVNLQGRIGYKGYTKQDFVDEGEGCLVLGGKHIDKNNRINLSDPEYLSWEKYYESPEIMVQKGDMIISQRGTLGKCLYIDQDYGKMTINPSLVLVNKIKNVVNPLFIWYNLQCDYLLSSIKIIGSTTTIPMLSQVEIGSFKMLVPPIIEQEDIVKYLEEKTNEFDTLISIEQQRIETLKEYRQSLISEVITGKVRVCEEVKM